MTGGKPKLKREYRDIIAAAEEEASLYGGSVSFLGEGGKHPRIEFRLGEQSRTLPFSGTPKAKGCGASHIRQKIRRAVRDMETS